MNGHGFHEGIYEWVSFKLAPATPCLRKVLHLIMLNYHKIVEEFVFGINKLHGIVEIWNIDIVRYSLKNPHSGTEILKWNIYDSITYLKVQVVSFWLRGTRACPCPCVFDSSSTVSWFWASCTYLPAEKPDLISMHLGYIRSRGSLTINTIGKLLSREKTIICLVHNISFW
jgi:hypothetical protein